MQRMQQWILMGVMGLLGSGLLGGGFGAIGLAQEGEPFSEEMQRLLDQYQALKTQSLTLMETVKSLQQDQQRLREEKKALKEALEESNKAKRELEDQYIKLMETVKSSQQDRRRLMTDQALAQKMTGALQAQVEVLKKRQDQLESALKESEAAYHAEQAQLKETTKKIKKMQKALETSEQANIDLQLNVAELQSLSRESRLAFNYELGRLYTRHGEYDPAIKEFQKTLELDPNYADAYRALGEIYREHLLRADLAGPYFRRYLELRPEAGDLEQIKGWLIKTKKEIDTRKAARQWGDGFLRNLGRIF